MGLTAHFLPLFPTCRHYRQRDYRGQRPPENFFRCLKNLDAASKTAEAAFGTAKISDLERRLRADYEITPRRWDFRVARWEKREEKESAGKPGSVEDSHSSGISVAGYLKQPTRKCTRAARCRPLRDGVLPYLALLLAGFAVP